jgi:hypothetical protein
MARPITTGSRSQRKTECLDCGNVAYKTPAQLKERGTDYCGYCEDTHGLRRRMTCPNPLDWQLTPQGQSELDVDYQAKAAKAGDREIADARRAHYPQLRCVSCQQPQTTEQSVFIIKAYERENQCAYDGVDEIRLRSEGDTGYRFSDGSSRYCACEKCGRDTLRAIYRPAKRERTAKAATLLETASCPF